MTSSSPRARAADPITPVVPTIEVRNLEHQYGDRHALRGISFSIRSGEVFGFLGPNGGGKSTLFRILSTMIPATRGGVSLLGNDPRRDLTAARKDLGVVFQAPSLDPLLTASENLMHQGHLYRLRGKALGDRSRELLEQFGLADRDREKVAKFSGGMRRRLEIAKALLHQPHLLLLDEPSKGLDPGARRDMWDHLFQLRKAQGVTIVFTTHLMEEADGAERVAILDQGSLVAIDTPDALKKHVGGDVITVETGDPETLAGDIGRRFDTRSEVVEGRVRIERPRGHEFVTELVEAFPGRILSVSVGKPTLEDVFLDLTGRSLAEADEAPSATGSKP